jgi:hypothetical protein
MTERVLRVREDAGLPREALERMKNLRFRVAEDGGVVVEERRVFLASFPKLRHALVAYGLTTRDLILEMPL